MALLSLTDAQRRYLLGLARGAIAHGLAHGRPLPVDAAGLPPGLGQPCATFVTLHRLGRLRGCIGQLEAIKPLAVDIADNAFAAAFRDPRFAPLTAAELDGLDIELSLLTPPEAIVVEGEQELLARLRPGVDGLVLQEGRRRATFLPSVWAKLPEPGQFVRQLKQKAGLPADYWSDTLRARRYRAVVIR